MSNSSDEYTLDDTVQNDLNDFEISKYDEEIKELEFKLKNFENPEEIKIDTQLKDDDMHKFKEQIKSMSRDQMINLIANFGKSNKIDKHKFSTVSAESKEQNKLRCLQKLNELKMRRTKKNILSSKLNNMMTSVNKSIDKSNDGKFDEPTDKHVDDQLNEPTGGPTNEPTGGSTNDPTDKHVDDKLDEPVNKSNEDNKKTTPSQVLSKSQKKRMRKKKNEHKQLSNQVAASNQELTPDII